MSTRRVTVSKHVAKKGARMPSINEMSGKSYVYFGGLSTVVWRDLCAAIEAEQGVQPVAGVGTVHTSASTQSMQQIVGVSGWRSEDVLAQSSDSMYVSEALIQSFVRQPGFSEPLCPLLLGRVCSKQHELQREVDALD